MVTMRFQRQKWRVWVALCATYLLVLQTSFVGLSLGLHALPAPLGNAICSSSAEAMPGAGQPADHAHQPECCLLGCGQSGPNGATPPEASALMVPRAAASALDHAADRIVFSREKGPRSTRAPPEAGSPSRA